jgi:hypothetical protein
MLRMSEYFTGEDTGSILRTESIKFIVDGMYRVFSAQANWTLTHTSHKDTEQSTVEASITLDGVTLTDSLLT